MAYGNQPFENALDGSGTDARTGHIAEPGDGEDNISRAPPTHAMGASQEIGPETKKYTERPPSRSEQGQSIQVDAAVASRIAANVEDFMVRVQYLLWPFHSCLYAPVESTGRTALSFQPKD